MSEAQYNLSKAELLDRIRQGHDDLVNPLYALNMQQMISPGVHPDSDWAMKDVLAHLTACMEVTISELPGHELIPHPLEANEGESWASQMERINQYYYEQNKDKPAPAVIAEFDKTYQQILREVESLSDTQLANPKVQELILSDITGHFDEHRGFIQDWLKQQEEDPILSKSELLNLMQQGHDHLLAALSGLSDAQMTAPGAYTDSEWSVKDTLAHFARWMGATPPRLLGEGDPFPITQAEGEDRDQFIERVNAYWHEQDRDKSLPAVRDEFAQSYQQQMLATVERLSDEQIATRPIQWRIIGNTSDHFDEHLGYIGDWLEKQKAGGESQTPKLPTRDELVAMMKQSHDKLVKALSGLSDAQMTSPGPYPDSAWTVKDTLAHCTAWMRATSQGFWGGNGNPFPFVQLTDEDDRHYDDRVNDYWRERDKDKSLATVRGEFEATFQQLLAVVERLSDEEIATPEVQNRIGNNSYWHFEGHLRYIGDWLKQQTGQA